MIKLKKYIMELAKNRIMEVMKGGIKDKFAKASGDLNQSAADTVGSGILAQLMKGVPKKNEEAENMSRNLSSNLLSVINSEL